jgi:SRSO17 transposase
MESCHKLPLEDSRDRGPLPWCGGDDRERPADDAAAEAFDRLKGALQAPRRGGLSSEALGPLGERLYECWQRCRGCFKPCTRDTSGRADDSLRGQWTRDGERHFAHMARTMTGDDGQAVPHFLSHAPWAGHAGFGQMQAESKATAAWAQGSTLMLEESADETAGTHHAGASRQDHGRLGKGDRCRVDPCLTSAHGGRWALMDGALFWPEEWCGEACAQTRHALGIPPERTFETQLAWGVQLVQRVKANGVPCDLLACDALDGRDSQCRADLAADHVQ